MPIYSPITKHNSKVHIFCAKVIKILNYIRVDCSILQDDLKVIKNATKGIILFE